MLKIKLTAYSSFQEDTLKAFLPGGQTSWQGCQFFVNQEVEECDYWVVFESMPQQETTRCPRENIIFITGEPFTVMQYNEKFLQQFAAVITSQREIKHPNVFYYVQGQPWFVEKSYDELAAIQHVEKTKLISVISSNKRGTIGHKKRYAFAQKLKQHFGDAIDLYGRGIRDFQDKWDVLAPYKYSITIENSVYPDYLTEKIGDCFLAHTFPLYYGCPNASDYYNEQSYDVIDINDFDKSVAIIEKILRDEHHYERHLPFVLESKQRYMDKYNLPALIINYIQQRGAAAGSNKELITLEPKMRRGNTFSRLKNNIKRALFDLGLYKG